MQDLNAKLTQLTPAIGVLYREQGAWTDRRLSDYLDETVAQFPNKVALIDPRSRITFRELSDLSRKVGAYLSSVGVGPGSVILMQLPNRYEAVVLAVACSRIGAVFTTVAPILREREIATILRLSQATVVVTVETFKGFEHAKMMTGLADSAPSVKDVVVIGRADVPRKITDLLGLTRRDLAVPLGV
jgi:non-ribosomal peptide synthetase component E (peptide arylation enzyme)